MSWASFICVPFSSSRGTLTEKNMALLSQRVIICLSTSMSLDTVDAWSPAGVPESLLPLSCCFSSPHAQLSCVWKWLDENQGFFWLHLIFYIFIVSNKNMVRLCEVFDFSHLIYHRANWRPWKLQLGNLACIYSEIYVY